MALIAAQKPAAGGTQITFSVAAAGGDSFQNSGKQYLLVRNANAASRTVTFDSPATCNFGLAGNAAHDKAIACAGNASTPIETLIGPFSPGQFNDGNDRVQVTYSSEVDVTIAVIEF